MKLFELKKAIDSYARNDDRIWDKEVNKDLLDNIEDLFIQRQEIKSNTKKISNETEQKEGFNE